MFQNDKYYNKKQSLAITKGRNLPHWHQDGKLQFITFRLADSLPQSKITELMSMVYEFKSENPDPWSDETADDYYNLISEKHEEMMHKGYGECILAKPEIRQIVEEAFKFYNGKNYSLEAFVIMPNHCHVLMAVHPDYEVDKIIGSLKRYTARQINKILSREGRIWQRDSFDRIVRNEQDHLRITNYIIENPRYLVQNIYTLWLKSDEE